MSSRYHKVSELTSGYRNSGISKYIDSKTKNTVVMKQLPKTEFDKSFFDNEVKINQMIKEKGVLKMIDHFETELFYCLVMVAGENNLFDFICNNGPLSEKDCISKFIKIFDTINTLHSLNVLHNDIKLENIVVKDDNLYLIDFGLSEILSEEKISRQYIGSQYYISPEIIRKQNHSFESDIYSLGVVMFAALAGQFPFPSENSFEYQSAQLCGNISMSAIEESGISKNLIDLVTLMMDIDPRKRPSALYCLNTLKKLNEV